MRSVKKDKLVDRCSYMSGRYTWLYNSELVLSRLKFNEPQETVKSRGDNV